MKLSQVFDVCEQTWFSELGDRNRKVENICYSDSGFFFRCCQVEISFFFFLSGQQHCFRSGTFIRVHFCQNLNARVDLTLIKASAVVLAISCCS